MSLILISCREAYYPDDLLIEAPIPVIRGRIVLNQPPEVKISWSKRFDENQSEIVSDAEVFISDHLGYEAKLDECDGIYSSPDLFGQAGFTYTLRVVLQDGREYNSIPQHISDPPSIDSLYAIPGERKSFVYGYYGQPVYTEEEGLFIHSALSSYQSNKQYLRFHTIVVKLSSYQIGTMDRINVYLWETKGMDNSYAVDFSVSDTVKQLLNHPVGFLKYYSDVSQARGDRSATIINAWVVTQTIYSISADVYRYYNSIGHQLVGNDQIFAPVASQVNSNIYCVSDKTERVIGIFEACSAITIYKAFRWIDLSRYESLDLDYFPEVGTGSVEKWAPDFWIHNYQF